MVLHKGQCHCRAVKFEFDGPDTYDMTECNCSICAKTGYQHIFVPEDDFRITQGVDKLITYRFGTGQAQHLFCQICGIKAFYRPRSHPESYSVNYRCIEPGTMTIGKVIAFDGQNWEQNINALKDETG